MQLISGSYCVCCSHLLECVLRFPFDAIQSPELWSRREVLRSVSNQLLLCCFVDIRMCACTFSATLLGQQWTVYLSVSAGSHRILYPFDVEDWPVWRCTEGSR